MTRRFACSLTLGLALVSIVTACGGGTTVVQGPAEGRPRMVVQDTAGDDLDGQTVDLGSARAGAGGAEYTFFVRNTGGSTLYGPGGGDIVVTLSGADAAHFAATPATITGLEAGLSAAVTLRLMPGAAQASGALSAQVDVDGDDETNQDASFALVGSVPAPAITRVTPASGPRFGGNGAVVEGTGFQSNATVSFGGVPATGVTVNDAGTRIDCSPPASPLGVVDVVVTNGNADTVTETSAYEFVALYVTQRVDASNVSQLFATLPSGVSTETQLTAFNANDGLSFVASTGDHLVYSLTITSDEEYHSIDLATGATIAITNRGNTNTRTYLGTTDESVPRIVFHEGTSAGVYEIFSARVDGSDAGVGAVHVSSLDTKVTTSGGSSVALITKETLPRVVFVNDANNHSYSARVDGTEVASPVMLVSSGSTNYLFSVAEDAIAGESAPRVVYRAASTGNQLFSVVADGSQGGVTQLTNTASPAATFRVLTREATPRVVFYRDDGGTTHLFSIAVDLTETGNIQKLSSGPFSVAVGTATLYGGPLGTGSVPRVCYTQSDGTRDQVHSVLVDGSAAALDVSQVTTNGASFRGILPGSPDRVFFLTDDAQGNTQAFVRNIDGTGAGATQVTSGDDGGGGEDSSFWGVVQGRYAITKRAEASGSPGPELQVYSWDLDAGAEAMLTAWYPTANTLDQPRDGFSYVTPTSNRRVLFHRTTGGVTQYFTVLADGSAPPVQLTNSVNSSDLVTVTLE